MEAAMSNAPRSNARLDGAKLFRPDEMPPDLVLPRLHRETIARATEAYEQMQQGIAAHREQGAERQAAAEAAVFGSKPDENPNNKPEDNPGNPNPGTKPDSPPGQNKPKPDQELPEPQPLPDNELPPEPEPEPKSVAKAEYDKLSDKHRTLEGKYRAEVPSLSRQLAEARKELDELKKKTLTPVVVPSKLTDDEVRDYGADMVDMIGRKAAQVAQELYGPTIDELRTKLSSAEEKLGAVGQDAAVVMRSSRDKYLDDHLPGWRATNDDPAFIDWLDQEDIASGIQRIYLLKNANDQRRFDRIVAIFQGYLREHGKSAQATTPPPAQENPVADTARKGSVPLETLVAPGGRKVTGKVPEAQAPQAVTRQFIDAYYRAKRKGLYDGKDAEVIATEKRINDALARGAVT